MKYILGKKLEMTQLWRDGKVVAVTKVQAGPCFVVQIKTPQKDGYSAVQLGFGTKKSKNIAKPQRGHLKGVGEGNLRFLREIRLNENEEIKFKRGDKIDISCFEPGDIVKVTGTSKGRGFQGVVKRHGFGGQPKTHGTKDQLRMPGSIGATGPAHVFKGTRMAGRMGGDKITVSNLEVVAVDKGNNILFIKGGLPGARNSLLIIKSEGEIKFISAEEENKTKQQKQQEVKPESQPNQSEPKGNKEEGGTVADEKNSSHEKNSNNKSTSDSQ
ncbi:50S ribosomal protein L3 [Candidatus Parcubacteria bacterium]|nr:MAG: 50S ribosomal protein L3 [Candidatus Parcubacteria bacterium]